MDRHATRKHIVGLLELALSDKVVKPELVATMLPRHITNPTVALLPTAEEVMSRQVRRLTSLGYPKGLFRSVTPPKSVFALLVVPKSYFPLKRQMALAGLDTEREDIYGGFEDFDIVSSLYWIYNISAEQFLPEYTLESFQRHLLNSGRRGLNFTEGVNLFAQTPNLFFNLQSASAFFGSVPRSFRYVPEISLFSTDPAKDPAIGPNSYWGRRGNWSVALTCSL